MSVEQPEQQISGLLEQLYHSSNVSAERETIMNLSNVVRQGGAEFLLDVVKTNLKSGVPEKQEASMTILDEVTLNCGPSFAVMLSSQKWMDRLIKLAKAGPPQVTTKIISTVIGWQKRYHTVSFAQCIKKLSQSKTTGEACKQALRQAGDDGTGSSLGYDASSPASLRSTGVTDSRKSKKCDAVLAELQSDLVSLEYSLENPKFVQDDAIARECKNHKMKCMQMLESGSYESIASDLMQLIERFSRALELYECMTGVDLGEGEAARSRALTRGKDNGGDSDDEYSKQLRARVAPKNAQQVMLQAQEATQQLVEKERHETMQLRTQLEEMRRKYEDMHNKYKDAKARNKEAVGALQEYAKRIEVLEKSGGGAAAAAAALPPPPPISEEKDKGKDKSGPALNVGPIATAMRDTVQVLRQSLREVREQYVSDIQKESAYYSSQLTSAIASIAAAAEKDRGSNSQLLVRTQELYKREMKLRKQYYNQIQELKGNIRVYCRVRPLLPREVAAGHTNIMDFPSADEIRVNDPAGRQKVYEFDEVYPPHAPQARVFEDTSPLIDSVVDGYNVCIFAYGQTGSGKTHTMGGYGEDRGINTRALQRLFEIIDERKDTDESTVTVSVLEIYCEMIRDLLVPKEKSKSTTYEVKQGGQFGTYVTNLSEVPVQCADEITKIMENANKNRSEGQTNMNEHSSRSHMVLYITVRTTNKETNMQCFGKLSLIDLAGSERLDKTGAEGQMLKEAVAINKSLSSLGDVISGLAQNSKHIPFRNSVLTYLLQDSMGGQAKVLMFVCVNPASYNASESNSSLQFASRARGVSLGQIKKNP
ncbi:C-terminal motor kinesin, putative [Trypanosoma brucei brucei TREU927]|uniref:Kinesin-like protein n=1 Tax=Trypanosoma brucei brucei (strain 927/4 GUTat10.1) TaxID=185431 RepID=Q388B7_TRYB2|nr:C-terminal motor kinesin, putative [Trypanosoma brucei brucei TREU927]EAN78855.1 C-terminal motor kinesin, putative [Trypanosoma brucei brucei TREU927]